MTMEKYGVKVYHKIKDGKSVCGRPISDEDKVASTNPEPVACPDCAAAGSVEDVDNLKDKE